MGQLIIKVIRIGDEKKNAISSVQDIKPISRDKPIKGFCNAMATKFK